uniref:Uncharacterized protein n=1 Tax=Romanomermis culicivorax TaxID=13658 RepID=A0A915IX28_ROMCU
MLRMMQGHEFFDRGMLTVLLVLTEGTTGYFWNPRQMPADNKTPSRNFDNFRNHRVLGEDNSKKIKVVVLQQALTSRSLKVVVRINKGGVMDDNLEAGKWLVSKPESRKSNDELTGVSSPSTDVAKGSPSLTRAIMVIKRVADIF